MPSYLLVGEDMIWVNIAAILVDLLAVDTRCTAAGFQVQTDAGQIGKFFRAPRTLDILSDMD